jgi:NADH-quinone oxidoreductase subunit C
LGLQYFCFLSVIDWLPSPFGRGMDAEVDRALAGNGAREPEPVTHGVTGGETRFQVFARLYSVTDHLGLTLKSDVPDDTGTVESWSTVFAGANWHEREAWEMYGVVFDGHPNLRNLYLPGAFEGHPLRKDFPLLSRVVKPWPGIVDVEGMPGVADDEGGE